MKKILFTVLIVLLVTNACMAKEIDRKVAVDTTVEEAQEIVLNVIKQYEGVVTVKESDTENHIFVVDYNKHTALSYIGVSNDSWAKGKYAQAAFSCQLKPMNNGKDTLITMRKHSYHGGIFGISTFDHYKKVYQELKFNGKTLRKLK